MAERRKEYRGSRPPPQKRPSTSSISILFVMAIVVVGAFIASGNFAPVDPNGPGGPPTLAPYYNPNDYPKQNIITPTGGFSSAKQNLQLQTFQVDNCGVNSVTLFVIDVSGSMKFYNKIGNEKTALSYFTSKMGGLSGIGIDSFGNQAKEELPITPYKDVKNRVQQVISSLTPKGYTHTREAFQLAYDQLKTSINSGEFPEYQYNVILMTDGVPEQPAPRTCYVQFPDPNIPAPDQRCFAKEQDPTVPTNIPDEMRQLGADVYVVNVYSPQYTTDAEMFPYLTDLLQKVASDPLSTHYFVSINGGNLNSILQNINNSICYNELNGTGNVNKQ